MQPAHVHGLACAPIRGFAPVRREGKKVVRVIDVGRLTELLLRELHSGDEPLQRRGWVRQLRISRDDLGVDRIAVGRGRQRRWGPMSWPRMCPSGER